MKLAPGLYETVMTDALDAALANTPWVAGRASLTPDEAADLLSRHVYEATRRALRGVSGRDALAEQLRVANRLIATLATERPEEVAPDDAARSEVLLSLLTQASVALGRGELPRPGIPLRHSDLIVNGPRDRRLGAEVVRELASADRVDMLMSFVKFSGLVELEPALAAYRSRTRGPLRVLTTTYMGATDLEALLRLRDLGADIRVSYDERRTRLHAKAWLFHRESGFSTGMVGSSNLSHAALRDGCEWNVRLSERDNPSLIHKFQSTFEQYWDDPVYEPFDAVRFAEATAARPNRARDALATAVHLRAYPHQQAVLDALKAERDAGHRRNLVVAATGTGKTVIAALDYARMPDRPTLLFVAHRDEILDQALATFRVAVRDGNFGEKLTGRDKPERGTHVFASVASLHADRLATFDPTAFDHVILDEFHHASAPTWEAVIAHVRPSTLLGLTATPERADGRSILHWFDGRIAAESRLWDALDQDLLVPFQVFMVHDGTDLSQVDFRGGRYDVASLERIYTADDARALHVLRALAARVRDPSHMRALGFCVSVAHAHFMAAVFNRHGLAAAVIEGATPPEERHAHMRALAAGKLTTLFTVDVFNEGVDIPSVDTVLFLRPTESATLFLQQLGRGLRLADNKACLTVLDFVGNAHRDFRFDLRLRALLGGGTRAELADAVDAGFPSLPAGCSIQLDAVAQRTVLENLRRSLQRWQDLARDLTDDMRLPDFLRRAQRRLDEVYTKDRSFSALRAAAGLRPAIADDSHTRALHRMLHIDDVGRLATWTAWLAAPTRPEANSDDPMQRMLAAALGHTDVSEAGLTEIWESLWSEDDARGELVDLLATLHDDLRSPTTPVAGLPLARHARYTRAEVCAALDILTPQGKVQSLQSGVYRCEPHRVDLLFVTLDKDEASFTPTTLYNDYPISPTRFHWESQSRTREDSPTGLRYRNPPPGWRILLFVRQRRKDARGVTEPFLLLGPVRYASHRGERPMQIHWQLDDPAPVSWFTRVKLAAG